MFLHQGCFGITLVCLMYLKNKIKDFIIKFNFETNRLAGLDAPTTSNLDGIHFIRLLHICLAKYFSNFNYWKLSFGFIKFRILLILLSLTLNYLFDICNLTELEPIYFIWTFVGLLIINSMYKSYMVSTDKAILYFVTLVLNILIIFITFTGGCYLLYLLNINVNDNLALKLSLSGFSLYYGLCMDPLSEYPYYKGSVGEGAIHNLTLIWDLWGFISNYVLCMDPLSDWEEFWGSQSYCQGSLSLKFKLCIKPAIHLADYFDCQMYSQSSIGEGGSWGGPPSPQPQDLPFLSQSNEDNPVEYGSNVYPPVPSTEEPESLDENGNFSNNLKYLFRKLIGIDLFNEIIKGNEGGKLCTVTKWIPMDKGPYHLDKCVSKPTVQLLLNKEFEGVNYKWFKINGVKSVFVKTTDQTYEGVGFVFKTSDEINLIKSSEVESPLQSKGTKYTASFNAVGENSPQIDQSAHSIGGENWLIYDQKSGIFEVGSTKLDLTLSIAERNSYYGILKQIHYGPEPGQPYVPESDDAFKDINLITKSLVIEYSMDPNRNVVHLGNKELPRCFYKTYSYYGHSKFYLEIVNDLYNKYLDVEFPSLKKNFSLTEKGLMYNKLFYEVSFKGGHGNHLKFLFENSTDDKVIAKNFIKSIGSIIIESNNDDIKSKWRGYILAPEAAFLDKDTLSEIRSVINHIEK